LLLLLLVWRRRLLAAALLLLKQQQVAALDVCMADAGLMHVGQAAGRIQQQLDGHALHTTPHSK
jgi:hypothetical protein